VVPSVLGMAATRTKYDLLYYLPQDLETVKGQEILLEDFGKGAFSFLIFENADDKTMKESAQKIKKIDLKEIMSSHQNLMLHTNVVS
jgi:uncharacterized membrane protein YdfJ with MMPL/SSD domain